MPDTKISGLTETTAPAEADELAIVQGGVTKKVGIDTMNSRRLLVELTMAATGPDLAMTSIPTATTGTPASINYAQATWTPTEVTDPGANWAANTFTAPVTGVYAFEWQGINKITYPAGSTSLEDILRVGVMVNGITTFWYAAEGLHDSGVATGAGSFTPAGHQLIAIKLNATDTAKIISQIKTTTATPPPTVGASQACHAGPASAPIRIWRWS